MTGGSPITVIRCCPVDAVGGRLGRYNLFSHVDSKECKLCCFPEFLSHIPPLISCFLRRYSIYDAAILSRASDARMKTRAAIYEFHSESPKQSFPNEFRTQVTVFESADDFQTSLEAWYWSRDRSTSTKGTLVVLEGLSADWTQPLLHYLDVPPSVISLHREWPGNHAAGKCRVPLGETPDRHAILRYRQPLPFRLRRKQKGMLAHTSPPPRVPHGCNYLREKTAGTTSPTGTIMTPPFALLIRR